MGRPENMDFPSCCTTMADSCVRNSEFVLCSTYVLYINRHKIPFHRISEYSCHAPLADNGTLFPLASRSGRFQCRAVTLIKHCRVQMGLGMRLHQKLLRMVSLATFGLVLLKLVFDDLWAMPTIGKIIVFIILGLILLILSFLYQKLKDVLFKNDEEETN